MPDLVYEKRDGYAVFTMNRPERRNARGGAMQEEFNEAVADFTGDPAMRCGIVTGAGVAFCAGGDLKEMAERGTRTEGGRPVPAVDPKSWTQFAANPKPFIAAINGLCISGGLELALDCDIRICSTEAYFGLFEAARGIMPGYAMQHLGKVVPFGEAIYLLLTADRFNPEQAYHCGLVHEVLEPEALMLRAVAIAKMIAANAPLAVEGIKTVAQSWRQRGVDETGRLSTWVARTVLASEDAREGPRAFAEKRPPVWKGR